MEEFNKELTNLPSSSRQNIKTIESLQVNVDDDNETYRTFK